MYVNDLEGCYDRWLGKPAYAWSADGIDVTVAVFRDVPEPGLHTFATIGLGAHELTLGEGTLRQELLLTCRSEYASWPMENHLFGAANMSLDAHRAYMRGDAVELGKLHPEVPQCRLTGFTFVDPARFKHDLVIQELDPPLVLVEMIPITRAEHSLIAKRGVDWLLDQFSDGKIDELNYLRK